MAQAQVQKRSKAKIPIVEILDDEDLTKVDSQDLQDAAYPLILGSKLASGLDIIRFV